MLNRILQCSYVFPTGRVPVAACSQFRSLSNIAEVCQKDGVKTVTLNDPSTRNSLSLEMIGILHRAVSEHDSSTRCVVIKAKGPVFSAGHNLKHIMADSRTGHSHLFSACADMMQAIQATDVPVLAEVNGVAAAAGCQLVAACDIVIASSTSTFSTPGGNVGIFCSTPGIPLVRCVPRKVSAYMLLTGRPLSAQEALQAGLVSRIVPPHLLEEETRCVLESILCKSKSVLALGKKFMYKQMEMPQPDAYRQGTGVMVDNINMTDGQEGIRSFAEKRKPLWTHSDE